MDLHQLMGGSSLDMGNMGHLSGLPGLGGFGAAGGGHQLQVCVRVYVACVSIGCKVDCASLCVFQRTSCNLIYTLHSITGHWHKRGA